jgi:CubicO group peptidase (beta-lactamase class C family)
VIQRAVAEGVIPGAVARIEQNGLLQANVATGWRDVNRGSSMSESTIFDVRSITKTVTAIAALTLVEEGMLNLDTGVKDLLPEIAALGAKTPITLRHLLTHTSGLRQERPPELRELTEKRDRPLEEVVAILARGRLIAEPGARWNYSSQGFAIVGRLVEVVSGQQFHSYVEERVLQPLGMSDSFLHPDRQRRERLASLYSWDEEAGELTPWPRTLPAEHWTYDAPDFGLYSTAADLTLLLNSMLPDSGGVLTQQSKSQMLTPHIETDLPGLFQGLGWFMTRDRRVCESLGVGSECYGANGSGGSMAWTRPSTGHTSVYLQQVFLGSPATGASVTRLALC